MSEPDLVDTSGNIKAHASLVFFIPISRGVGESTTVFENLTDSVIKVRVKDVGSWELPLGPQPTERIFSISPENMRKMNIGRPYDFLVWDETNPSDSVRLWSGKVTLDGFR